MNVVIITKDDYACKRRKRNAFVYVAIVIFIIFTFYILLTSFIIVVVFIINK